MRFKKATANIPEMDMTPMIDIVFQLVAFFMVISNFEQAKADERVKLPRDPLARPPQVKPEREIVVNFGYERDLDGNIVDETPYVFEPGEPFTVDEYAARLRREAEIMKEVIEIEGEGSLDEVDVAIRADAEVPTGQVQKIIEYAQEAGFSKFSMKATQKSQ